MKSTVNHIVEHPDLKIDWYAVRRGALIRKGPRPDKNGLLWLGGLPYAPNSRYWRREVHRRFSRLPWPLVEESYSHFAYGIPDQMPGWRDFPQVKKMEEIMSSTLDTFAQAAESRLTQKWLRGAQDFLMLLLALGAGAAIGIVIGTLLPGVK